MGDIGSWIAKWAPHGAEMLLLRTNEQTNKRTNERTNERTVMITRHSIGSIGDAGAGWIETYLVLRMDIIVLRCLPPFKFWRGRLCLGLAG